MVADRLKTWGAVSALWALALLLAVHAALLYPGGRRILQALTALAGWMQVHDIKAGDYIALVSAIATMGAVFVALWLARADRRERQRQSLLRAQLAAARVSSQLQHTHDWVLNAWVNGMFTGENHVSDLSSLGRMIKLLREPVYRIDPQVLIDLAPLPNSCAHRIARAFDYIDRICLDVAKLPAGDLAQQSAAWRSALRTSWIRKLSAANELLTAALMECHSATALGAPLPSEAELNPRHADLGDD